MHTNTENLFWNALPAICWQSLPEVRKDNPGLPHINKTKRTRMEGKTTNLTALSVIWKSEW